jgi:hypothetical protein
LCQTIAMSRMRQALLLRRLLRQEASVHHLPVHHGLKMPARTVSVRQEGLGPS